MQPYKQKYKPWRYLQTSPEVDRINAALFVEELVEIYSTPTPKDWLEVKKVIGIDWLGILFTIAGVQYLYPKPKHESYPNMTYYTSWKNNPNLR